MPIGDFPIAGFPIAGTGATVIEASATIIANGICSATASVIHNASSSIIGQGIASGTASCIYSGSADVVGNGICRGTAQVAPAPAPIPGKPGVVFRYNLGLTDIIMPIPDCKDVLTVTNATLVFLGKTYQEIRVNRKDIEIRIENVKISGKKQAKVKIKRLARKELDEEFVTIAINNPIEVEEETVSVELNDSIEIESQNASVVLNEGLEIEKEIELTSVNKETIEPSVILNELVKL